MKCNYWVAVWYTVSLDVQNPDAILPSKIWTKNVRVDLFVYVCTVFQSTILCRRLGDCCFLGRFSKCIFSFQLLSALESKVKHAQCFDVSLMDDGSVVLASKDYRLYIYRYVQLPQIGM